MPERRYNEDEVAEIFKQATEAQQSARRPLASGEGMTLADLQAIGKEVGVPPELVAQAATALDTQGGERVRRLFGLPVGVGRTVHLGRFLSEEEWERLVVDLRDTFDARGTIRHEGTFHSWTNGNLQALLEPTPTGHQLRLRTVKGNSRRLMVIGAMFLTTAGVMLLAKWLSGGSGDVVSGLTTFLTTGAIVFGVGALTVPGWAKLRTRQMEGVAARLALEPPSASPELPSETT